MTKFWDEVLEVSPQEDSKFWQEAKQDLRSVVESQAQSLAIHQAHSLLLLAQKLRAEAEDARMQRANIGETPKKKQKLLTSFFGNTPEDSKKGNNPFSARRGARGPVHPACQTPEERKRRLKTEAVKVQANLINRSHGEAAGWPGVGHLAGMAGVGRARSARRDVI